MIGGKHTLMNKKITGDRQLDGYRILSDSCTYGKHCMSQEALYGIRGKGYIYGNIYLHAMIKK